MRCTTIDCRAGSDGLKGRSGVASYHPVTSQYARRGGARKSGFTPGLGKGLVRMYTLPWRPESRRQHEIALPSTRSQSRSYVKRIRRQRSAIAVRVIAAPGSPVSVILTSDARRRPHNKVFAYLRKPFPLAELLRHIHRLHQRRSTSKTKEPLDGTCCHFFESSEFDCSERCRNRPDYTVPWL
jgi:hypothetical protein